MKQRMKTRDVAFQFRMGAGFAGALNRIQPASIEPTLINTTTPPTLYGQAIVVDAAGQGVRPLVAADNALAAVYGVTVRPYPTQQSSAGPYGAAPFGSVAPPVAGIIDVLRAGYILVQLGGTFIAAKKGAPVYVWTAVSAGAHVQGAFEDTFSAGNTTQALVGVTFNGAPDATGITEICFNV